MSKLKGSSKSVDWTPAENVDNYTQLQRLADNSAESMRELIDAYHVHADDDVREAYADRIGMLLGMAESLSYLAMDSASAISVIGAAIDGVGMARTRHHSTRAVAAKEAAIKTAEDIRTIYVRDMGRLFTGTLPAWLTPSNTPKDQLRKTCLSASSQGSALIKSKQHVQQSADKQISATVNTAVGRGDYLLFGRAQSTGKRESPLKGLPNPVAQAHRVLAALDAQFAAIGWKAPLAVAVVERTRNGELEHKAVYTTTDGISIWPSQVLLPVDTYPITYLRDGNLSEVKNSLGMAQPVAKLLNLLDPGWDVKGLATSDIFDTHLADNPDYTQDSSLTKSIIEYGEAPVCTVNRSDLATVKPHQAVSVFNRVRQAVGKTKSLQDTAQYLVLSRWLGNTAPRAYVTSYMEWLLSDAHTALREGDPLRATWPLTELEDLTT